MKKNTIIYSILFVAALLIYSCSPRNLQQQANIGTKQKGLIPSSSAVPKGMELFWHDEFNDHKLDSTKWFKNYFSTYDYPGLNITLNSRPQPIMSFTDSCIVLLGEGRVSSIQTYDWGTNKNLLDNSRGGYFEVRVRRSKLDPKGKDPNTAFWLDAPGPDLKRYMEEGNTAFGVTGIRPRGQAFEIDVFERLNAELVAHGNVAPNGAYEGWYFINPAKGYTYVNNWLTYGILWGPGIVSQYVNGDLIKTYNSKTDMFGPNHFMNILLGAYENGKMEVDYIRGYRWPLKNGNELPNPDFDINTNLLPWEGTGTITNTAKHHGNFALKLAPNQFITQYVFLNNNTHYQLGYWINGVGDIEVKVENIKPVKGTSTSTFKKTSKASIKFRKDYLNFKTEKMYGDDLKMVKVTFKNIGREVIILDNTTLTKGGDGGLAN